MITRTLSIVILFSIAAFGVSPDTEAGEQWVNQIGGKGAELVFGVTETANGSICTTGTFWTGAQFGSNEDRRLLKTSSAQDVFVACYEQHGQLTYARRIGAKRGDEARAIAALPNGDIVLAGIFATRFGQDHDTALQTDGNADIFVMRLDPQGNTVWSRQFGGSLADSGNALAVAPTGEIFLAGNFSGSMRYQSRGTLSVLKAVGNRDAVVMKLAPSGDVLWARQAGGNGFDEATAIALAPDGGVLLAGTFRDRAVIGDEQLTSYGYRDVFVLALDAGGEPRWTQQIGGIGQDEVRGLAVDGAGGVHVAGNFQKTLSLQGDARLRSVGNTDVYIARYSQDGELQRANSFGGALTDQVFALAMSGDDRLWLTGHYQGDADVAPGADVVRLGAPSPGNSGAFIVELDQAGNHAWSSAISGSGMEMSIGVTALAGGGAGLAGLYNNDLKVPSVATLENRGKTDVFVARIVPHDPDTTIASRQGVGTNVDW